MNKKPCISVIVPIFNMDAYLRTCLDSILGQTLDNIEVVCINDGSTDYTQSILEEYSWNDKRVKVITQENKGVAVARNKGIEIATGEFLFFLDPDAWLPDEKVFEDLYKTARENNVLICGGEFREVLNGKIIDKWEGNLSKYTFPKEGIMLYSDYQFDYGWVRFIYNRDFLLEKKLNIPSLTFFEDPVFFVRIMHEAEKFYAMKRCTYCYRTGHKKLELSYEKTNDLVKGLCLNILFAKQHQYKDLLALEVDRIEKDYAEFIAKYLDDKRSTDMRDNLEKINRIIFQDNNKVEYQLLKRVIKNREYSLYMKDEEFYKSTTWKVGNAILFIPKFIKRILKGE